MFKDILTVAKKELKSCFSDKAILAQILLLPFLMVFGYSMLMPVFNETTDEADKSNRTAYYINAPEYMVDGFVELGLKNVGHNKTDTIKNDISEKNCDLLIVFPKDFTIAEVGAAALSNVEIWYNSESSDSVMLYSKTMAFLDAFQPKVFTVNADADTDYDFGDADYGMKQLLGIILPVIILMSVFMVCMNLAAESIAGDKERGFLNTMLIAPIKRSSIAAGKSLCIFAAAVIGGISAFVGMAAALPKLAESSGAAEGIFYSISEYLLLFAVTITAVFALAGVLLILSTVAKDVKQATSIAPALMLVLMVASMLTVTESFGEAVDDLGMKNACIPAWNTMVVMQDIIAFDYSPAFAVTTCLVNLLFAVIAIFVTGRLFEKEKIVNG
ncbi:MAG: ABC transporter permease [Oscillospiraceae bacterium]|nr:ABC transporter permease [Oscillospiraceae bacterium]